MKQLLFLILFTVIMILLFGCKSYGQMNTGMGIGYDIHGRPISVLSIGYSKSFITFQGEIRPSLTRSRFQHTYYGFRAGFNLLRPEYSDLTVSMGAGFFHDLRSLDFKEQNKNYAGTFIKGIQMINDRAGLMLDLLYINNSLQISGGIHYVFN